MTCGISGQQVPAGTLYLAWTKFVGDPANNVTKLVVATSKDCGVTWAQPIKISEGFLTNQGATMAVSPSNGALYVVWRQFLSGSGKHAILFSKSTDFGSTFSKPALVANISPFDQGTSVEAVSFRTNSYPTAAADATGRVYVAWSQRGVGPGGDARIVVSMMDNGAKFFGALSAIDSSPSRGNQFMPSITVAGGKVQVLYYDLQEDHLFELYHRPGLGDPPNLSWPYIPTHQWFSYADGINDSSGDVFREAIADRWPVFFTRRHNIDVRTAQAVVASLPSFSSAPVSRYPAGTIVTHGGDPDLSGTFVQLAFNPPNLPLYAAGTSPFVGDYIDVAAVSFIRNPTTGAWSFNAAAVPGAPPTFHAVWTDNRDVTPPPDGKTWADYTPPRPGCSAGTTGMRNANIYTAAIMPPLMVGSLDNSKALKSDTPRAFPVFALNTTDQDRTYTFTISSGNEVWASFDETELKGTIIVPIGKWSGAARTVYAKSSTATSQLTVNVTESSPTGTSGSVVLNPDPLNPSAMNPSAMNETYNPSAMNREITNPAVMDPSAMNPSAMNPSAMNPSAMNPTEEAWALINPAVINPSAMNPSAMNPSAMNPSAMNPSAMNPSAMNQVVADPSAMNPSAMNPSAMNAGLGADAIITDVTWTIKNDGNAAASYRIDLSGKEIPKELKSQLILHKRYVTPAPSTDPAKRCEIGQWTQNVVLANIPEPEINTSFGANDASYKNPTMSLEPGETGYVTLRIFDYNRMDNLVSYDPGSGRYYAYDPTYDPKRDVAMTPAAQPANEPPSPTGMYTVEFVTPGGQPPDTTAGQPLGNVRVQVTGSGTTNVAGALVTITLVPNGNPGILAGTFTAATGPSGVATFSDLRVSEAGTGYRLRAYVPGANPVNSNPFTILGATVPSGGPGGSGSLLFLRQPTASLAGQAIQGLVAVAAQDPSAARLPGLIVTLTVGANPGGATISSNVAMTDSAGVAYFPRASLDRAGSGYTLLATSGAVSAASTPFDVTWPLGITTTTVPIGVLADLLSATIQATGGTPPYDYAVSAGTLPPGVTLAADGTLSGAPTLPGAYTFTTRVTDASTQLAAERSYTVRVFAPDQQATPPSGGTQSFGSGAGVRLAQTFVSNAGGTLEGVRIAATCSASDAPPALPVLAASIYGVDADGHPVGSALASGAVDVPLTTPHAPGTLVPILFSAPLPVAPGFTHALVVRGGGVCTVDLATYASGTALSHDNDFFVDWHTLSAGDLQFQTLVTPLPEVVYPVNWRDDEEVAVALLSGRILILPSGASRRAEILRPGYSLLHRHRTVAAITHALFGDTPRRRARAHRRRQHRRPRVNEHRRGLRPGDKHVLFDRFDESRSAVPHRHTSARRPGAHRRRSRDNRRPVTWTS